MVNGGAEAVRSPLPLTKATAPPKTVHAIVDNYATHKHPKVRQWLDRHPRWTFHFTPTSASWLNAVEGFFATYRLDVGPGSAVG
jgi:DDE superfamily endonuclease